MYYGQDFSDPQLQAIYSSYAMPAHQRALAIGTPAQRISDRGGTPDIVPMIVVGGGGFAGGSILAARLSGSSMTRGGGRDILDVGRAISGAGKTVGELLWTAIKRVPRATLDALTAVAAVREGIVGIGEALPLIGGKRTWGLGGKGAKSYWRWLDPTKGVRHLAAGFRPYKGSAWRGVGRGAKRVAGVVGLGAAINTAFIGYDVLENKKHPGIAAVSFIKDIAAFTAGMKVGGLVGEMALGPIGGVAGALAGGLGLSILTSNKTFTKVMGLPNFEAAAERAALVSTGYGYRNPFRPGSYGIEDNAVAATLREVNLMAIHKSPLNDRALLLGREASRMHL
jgi:hypothetical protein